MIRVVLDANVLVSGFPASSGTMAELIDHALMLLRDVSEMTPITVHVSGIATHPEDDLVLAAAVSAGADFLVTGDKQLLALGQYLEVDICSPRALLEILP